MNRVFLGLAWGNALVLVGTGLLGLSVEGERLVAAHLGLAVFAGLLACLTHAVVFTYFTASGKMIRQAVFIGRLDKGPSLRVSELKRHVSRTVGPAVLGIVAAVASGAFILGPRDAVALHRVLALAAVAINLWAFRAQYRLIVENSALLAQVMQQYEAQRRAWRPAGGSPLPRQPQTASEPVGADELGGAGLQCQRPGLQEAR